MLFHKEQDRSGAGQENIFPMIQRDVLRPPTASVRWANLCIYIYICVCVCINCINITICHSPSGTQILVLMLILCLSRQTGGRFRKHESTMIYGCCVKSRCQKQLICLLEQHVQARRKSDRKGWERMRT